MSKRRTTCSAIKLNVLLAFLLLVCIAILILSHKMIEQHSLMADDKHPFLKRIRSSISEDKEPLTGGATTQNEGKKESSSAPQNRTQLQPSSFKFPTPHERVKYYMGSWYNRSITSPNFCDKLPVGSIQQKITSDKPTLYSLDTLYARNQIPASWLSEYLRDAANVMTHVESQIQQGEEDTKYIILNIGDSSARDRDFPAVSKARSIPSDEANGYKPIIWPLRMDRHFHDAFAALHEATDTPWEQKKNEIVWRGKCTNKANGPGASKGGVRLKFVQKFGLVYNIGMDGSCKPFKQNLPKQFEKPIMTVTDLLRYKYLLNLEGNDVSSGLKWQLASSSVVFMPKPTAESFAMEALLQPYVHYIPVKDDGSDLEAQIQWAKDNDEKARWISNQAMKYMEDLWLSHQAEHDNLVVKHDLASLYHERFAKDLDACYKKKKNNGR